MKVIEYDTKIYELKISIADYVAIYQLGLIDRLSTYPSTVDYLSLCSILLRRYNLDEEQLYDFMDFLVDQFNINIFLKELLRDSGLYENNSDQVEEQEEIPFEEQLDSMLKDCLAYGLSIDTFYSMTFKEVKLFIEGTRSRIDLERKDKAMFDYLLANLITTGTGIILGSKAPFPKYEEYYASIFGEESQEEMELEGFVTDDLGNKTPIYKHKFDASTDLARAELLAIAQQQKISSLQKELNR